ncbi:MAG TPA: hypothetical protein VN018_05315 [Brevundimonas sp.]|nr:hypothetical protein [Brevundimonas sp.]
MPYSDPITITFNPADYAGADTEAKEAAVREVALKLFGFYNGGQAPDPLDPNSATTPASPELVFDGADSCVRATFSHAPVEVQGAFMTKALMDADLDAAAGMKVNCFDPAEWGRYQKIGAPGTGSWSRVGDIADRLWWDDNHPRMGLGLMPFGSGINTDPVFPLFGDKAIYPAAPGNDWRRARITYVVCGVNLKKPPLVKFALGAQGDIPERTLALPQVHPDGNYFFPNFYNRRQLLSDALGFNQPDSWGQPDLREEIANTGWVEWVVDMSIDDLDWQAMGGIPRDYAASPYYYGVCPIEELLRQHTGNFYWFAIYPREPATEDDYFARTIMGDVSDELSGEIRLKSIKVEFWED